MLRRSNHKSFLLTAKAKIAAIYYEIAIASTNYIDVNIFQQNLIKIYELYFKKYLYTLFVVFVFSLARTDVRASELGTE